ncbi:MAG TPA: family 78 glycoside hydrolase catalytic domain, partial [Candidatus Merdenecus merdavium]|nr:family 78 glycoside hydrolase catalytic domain [Candidatus Merdenecus merdavium]
MLKVAEIKVNYERNPEGITGVPLFSWVLWSDKRNVVQDGYQLQISEDPSFNSLCYDSGKKESDLSARIIAEELDLKSASKYYVRVKVEAGHEISPWSETYYFITALLDVEEWKASFITAETKDDAGLSKGTYVRNTFRVKGKVKQALAYTTALGLYEFYMNGKKVGNDELTPGWTSYHKHLTYQTYEVTSALVEGRNGLGASLGAGWYKGTMGFDRIRNLYGDRTAFLCQLVIQYEDGTTDVVVSDETWVGHDSPVLFAEIYDGEIYDARKEIEGWSKDTLMDDSWKPVEIIEIDKKILDAQIKNRVQEIDKVEAKRIFKTPQGHTVIDFGQNMTGRIHVRAKGKPEDVIELHCFEVLDQDGNVYLDNLRGAKQSLTYTFAREEEIQYHPTFTFMGFQFAKIVSYPGEPKIEDFTAYTTHTFMEPTGTLETSNPYINQLSHNILWGMKGNFVDVPTDCPQRDE